MSERADEPVIYLDHAATTPIASEVIDAMSRCLDESVILGNPSSLHRAGRLAAAIIDESRASVADLVGAGPRDMVFTSGATESDNLAIKGAARFRAHRGRHIITMSTEHKAVLESVAALESEGFDVTRLDPDTDGVLSLDNLRESLRDDTQLVSVMHVNNETGVVQDIDAIGQLCRQHDILFHTDAAQSAGKLPLDVRSLPVDLLSLTAHKFHGPQGIGALYIADRPGCGLAPLFHGGSQERRVRPGTEPVALIAGFAEAARLAADSMQDDIRHKQALCDRLWRGLSEIEGLRRNGSVVSHYPGILNVSVDGIEGESLMLDLEPLCVASGSACNARAGEASFVLRALGLTDLEAQGAVRFSFGRTTSRQDVDRAAVIYRRAVNRLRLISAPATA